ncbi:MAG TPA: CusA/CzcA family heavy metal efflux RND transporter [Candidatus Melainabacteria bacterium]|nr:CusA/CzcA family heavy metal efflux RND transporter [Candidatus Melainabacteria bacterium]
MDSSPVGCDTNPSFMHRLTDWLIGKRYFVVFLLLVVLASGVVAYRKLPLEAFPDIANMQVRVITQVPGKAPEEVERLVTIPIEKEVNGIPNSKAPRSISIFGLSVVTVVFDDHAEPYIARQQVLERLANVDLPDGIEPEIDPNASPVGEIYRYTLQGRHWSSMDRKETQDWLLNRLFKSVDGIVDSTGFGGPTKIFLVEMDPGKLRAFGVSQNDIRKAIARSNDSTGGSYIVSNDQRYLVRGLGLLKSVKDIEAVVITSSSEGTPVRVKDVATVKISAAVRKGQVGLDEDDDAVEGILMMRRGDNPSRVIENLREAWSDIESQLPEGMKIVPLQDRTALVDKTIETISHNVAEGIILVVVILMLFLFQVRSALICSIVIPTALLASCIALKVFEIPANLLSLGAIDFGIIVDGAVIMVENIMRRISRVGNDEKALRAGICEAVSEIAKPILFSTAIIALTFLPILSFEHVEGRLFKPLAVLMNLVLLAAVLTTMLVVPVVCYLVFRLKPPSHRENPLVVFLENYYLNLTNRIQRKAKLVLVGICIFIIASISLVPMLGAEFIPELEEGNIWLTVTIRPASVSLENSVEIARKIRKIMRGYPETTSALTQIGSPDDGTDPNPYNLIEVLVGLNPQSEWRSEFKTKEKLVESMSEELNKAIPGLVLNFSQCIKDSMEEAMSGVKNGEYAVKIYGPDLRLLEDHGGKVAEILKSVPGIVDVAQDNLLGQPQMIIEIDRKAAAREGISTEEVLDIVETSIGGQVVTRVLEGERRFDVVLRLDEKYRNDLKKLGNIEVTAPSGLKLPLRQLASVKQMEGANAILRDENKRRVAVYANIRGRDLGSAVLESQRKIAAELKLPPGYSLKYAGEFERARAAGERLTIVVPGALVIIFTLLYLAFDSAFFAVLAMGAVPVAAAVAILILLISGTNLSISSGVGLIVLFGLSIQNAVIVVSAMKTMMEMEAIGAAEAIGKAATTKMNAVVIAALVAAVGLAPAAMSTGIGSQSQKPFAIVIACGILPATLLTLLLLPALAKVLSTLFGINASRSSKDK